MDKLLKIMKITIGSILYSVAISLFLAPNELVTGGVTGIAILFHRFLNMETGTLVLLINIPILIIGTIKFGAKFIISTLYCTLLYSALINYFSTYEPITTNPILAVLAGASLDAVGLGLILKGGATSGGIDILVKLLKRKYPHMKTGALFLLINSVVVGFSVFVFGNIEAGIYAALVVIITSMVLDVVLYGKDEAKMILIISGEDEKISKRLLEEINLGVTILYGKGGYSQKDTNILLCIVKKPLYSKLEVVVKEEDPRAFLIVSSATEIYGEGYKSYFGQKL